MPPLLSTPDANVVITDEFRPVTVEEVAVQTDVVVESYFSCRCSQNESEYTDFISEGELNEHYTERQIGQSLAVVAEEVEKNCGSDLDRLVDVRLYSIIIVLFSHLSFVLFRGSNILLILNLLKTIGIWHFKWWWTVVPEKI